MYLDVSTWLLVCPLVHAQVVVLGAALLVALHVEVLVVLVPRVDQVHPHVVLHVHLLDQVQAVRLQHLEIL